MLSRIAASGVSVVFLLVAAQAAVNTGRVPILAGTVAGALAVAAVALWFAIRAHSGVDNVRWRRTVRMALIVGLAALLAGYVLPIVLMPDANQGPLIGIFGTGPAGFALGALAGYLFSRGDLDAPHEP